MSKKSLFKKGHKQTSGENSPHWKNSRTKNKQGYILRTVNKKLEFEHRIVAKEKIGRQLKNGEVVHHINGRRDDNRPENLMVLPSHSEHMRLELKKYYWLGK